MDSNTTIYILGSGAVGFPLAVCLATAGRRVVAVRTSRDDVPASTVDVTVQTGTGRLEATLDTISLARLEELDGLIVVAAKSYANEALAAALKDKGATCPLVIMQNGLDVETPFVAAGFPAIYRCVLYMTSQTEAANHFSFRPVTSSSIGIIQGDETGLQACVAALHSDAFPFHGEANIQREIWKKAIMNTVFNSILPLLDVDNGIFARDARAAALAAAVIRECVSVTKALNLDLGEDELLAQVQLISGRSQGQWISTLQDIRAGRPTEIDSLNLAIARLGAEHGLSLPRVELLGQMILTKSGQ